jgi:hypothetical protein
MKDSEMSTDETAQSADKTGPLPFDTTTAHQARVYDYLLGGKDNYEADRVATEAVLKVWPGMGSTARANRAFLGRAVRYLTAEAGMEQFLDIGTGIPTAGNTHEIAQAIAPKTRVVYVDYDPIVLAHARTLLTSGDAGATEYIEADLRDTGMILDRAAALLDFSRPVAVTMLALLHAIPDSDAPYAIVTRLLDAVPSGSYLAISHGASDLLDQATMRGIDNSWNGRIQQQFAWRSRDEVARFFTGTDLVEPGLVPVGQWRPDPETTDDKSAAWGAVGRKR